MFEQEFEKLLERERKSATGQRLEQLHKDLTGTKKLLEVLVWPVLKSFDEITLEYEVISTSGVKIYIDVYFRPLGLSLECEGFVVHAERITRDRFSFEKMRVRTMAIYGDRYIPFSKDELDKNPGACQRALYELLGRYSSIAGKAMEELTVYEREVIRYGMGLNRHLRIDDVKYVLKCQYDFARKVREGLIEKRLIRPIGKGTQRFSQFELSQLAKDYMLFK
jgi:hypothetical protein